MRAPSERSHQERGQRHTKLTDWARQLRLIVRRGAPERALGLVTESRFAVMTLLWRLRQLAQPLCRSTRVRLEAALYEPALPRKPRQTGCPRVTGQRRPTLAHVLANPATCWQTAPVRGWYGGVARVVERVSDTAVW